MNKIVCLTPNWNLSRSLFPTDTLRPPPNFPLEWGYISSGLSESQIYIMDEYSRNASFHSTTEQLSILSPQVAILSTTPSYLFWRCPPFNLDIVRQYAFAVRRSAPTAVTIIIGPHGTIDPQWTLKKTQADYVFRGEPDLRLAKILDQKYEQALLNSPWVAKLGKETVIAPQLDFSQIGTVNYKLMDTKRYVAHAWGQEVTEHLSQLAESKVALVECSRGCTFDCPYCLRTGFRNRYRFKPIESIQHELDQLTGLGVRYVYFIDETFGLSWKLTQKVINLLYQHGIKYGIQTRPDILKDERITELASTGCIYVELGTEANQKDWLIHLRKFRDLDSVFNTVSKLRQVIPFVNNNILDLSNEDYIEKIDFTAADQVDNSGNPPPPFMPYPTTPFGDEAISHYKTANESVWDVGEDLYILYSLISRYAIIRRLLLRRRNLRRKVRQVIKYVKKLEVTISMLAKSRFEILYGRNRNV